MKTLIAAAALLASTSAYAAPKGEWFLLFDTRFCDVHDCGERQPPQEFVYSDTFITRKQCLTAGRRLIFEPTTAPYVFAKETSTPIGEIVPRCEWSVIY